MSGRSSGKTTVAWLGGLLGWLALGALLGWLGMPAALLLALNAVALGTVLLRLSRATALREAAPFLAPFRDGPSALTPPGVAAEWLSGFGIIGTVALVAAVGIDGFAVPLGMIGGLVLSSGLFAPALAASGARTPQDWAAARFGEGARRPARIVLAVFGALVLWVQFAFAGLLAEAAFGLPAWTGIAAAALLAPLCVLAGGMVTMVPAQAILFVVAFVGVLVPTFWLGVAQTGTWLPHLAPGALLHEIVVAEARLGIAEGFMAADPARAAMLGLTAMLGTMALPHTLLRWPSERGPADAAHFAQRGVVLAMLVLLALPIIAIAARAADLVPALARLTTPDMPQTARAALAGTVRLLDPPAWLHAAIGSAALSAILAASASAILTAAGALARTEGGETAGGLLSRLRWTGGGTTMVAALLALVVPVDPVLGFLTLLVLAASTLLAPLVAGLFWQRATAAGAGAGMLAGLLASTGGLAWGGPDIAQGAVLFGVAASALTLVGVSLMGERPDPARGVRPSAPPPPPR